MLAAALMIMTGALFSACDSGGSNGAGQSGALIPLQVENVWRATNDEGNTETFRVTADEQTFDGETYKRIDADLEYDELYARETENGGIVLQTVFGSEVIDFRLRQVSGGESYTYTDNNDNTFTVEVSQREVSVPAGTFEGALCYDINAEEEGAGVDAQACIAPGEAPLRYSGIDGDYILQSYDVD